MRAPAGTSLRPVLEVLEPRVLLSGELYISEFMALNESVLMDEDGQYSDWIEIVNAGEATVDLGGWYLTDDPAVLDKWAFPSVQLPAGRMLTVFASGKDRADPDGELHTNFRLSANGEYLALVRPDGLTVEHEYAPQYPPQLPDVSYGLATQWSERALSLISEQTPLRALVPTDGSLGTSWTAAGFDDSTWLAGPQAVGYETQSDYDPLIGTDVEGQMYRKNASVYVRLAFGITDPSQLYDDVLTLRVKYDDGFVAYLNGVEVAARNAPETPRWNSAATSWHMDQDAVVFEDVDISEFADLLQVGTNVLAVHGLNYGADSFDMLIAAELVEVGAVVVVQPGAERYFTTPTPGAGNTESFPGVVGDTDFSVDRGFYSEPFDVAITCPTAGAEIRYTLDGTAPTATHGFVYTAPIHIETTTVLRAAAFKLGYVPSDVDTQTYIFIDDVLTQTRPEGYPTSWSGFPGDYEMDPQIVQDEDYADILDDALLSIPTISIVTDPANLFDSTSGIYTHPTESGVAWERPVSVEWIDPTGGQEFQIDCGLRIQGGASREPRYAPKHSFRLLFKSDYGAGKLRHPLFGDEAADRFDTIVLRAGFNHSWIAPGVWRSGSRERAQYVRDQWAKDTQRAMGGLGPHNNYAHLYINGMYWGLYNPTERPDAAFAATYLGGRKEEYDALNSGEVVDGDDGAWERMFSMADAGLADRSRYEELAKLLDIDAFIDYMILNQYIGNNDWDWHNWYAFRRRTADGKFYFVNWDSEWIFMDVNENRLDVDNDRRPTRLFNKLIENAEFRLRFADHVHRHFFNDGALTPQAVVQRWDALSGRIYDAVVAESARWGDYRRDVDPRGQPVPIPLYERDVHWLAERRRLLNEYFPYRTDVVLNQYIAAGLYPSVAAPEFNRQGGSVPEGFELTMDAPGSTIYYTLDGTDPRLPGGAVASAAAVYEGPIALTAPAHVMARARSGDTWSALNEARFAIAGSPIRIGELMYNPAPADDPVRVIDEDFDDGSAEGFQAVQGAWTVTDGRYHAQPIATYDYGALTVAHLDSYLPEDFSIAVTMTPATSDSWGFVVFDYQGPQDFRFAGMAQDEGRWIIGHRDSRGWTLDAVAPATIVPGQDYRLEVAILDDAVSLRVDGQTKVAWNFGDALADGAVGLGGRRDEVSFDELALDAVFDNDDYEFVELYNSGAEPVDLQGMSFTDGIAFVFGPLTLPAGQRALVVRNLLAFRGRYDTAGMTIAGQYDGNLANGGEHLRLADAAGGTVFEFDYADWYPLADGEGWSLAPVDPNLTGEALNLPENWRPSEFAGGSPGGDDNYIAPGTVVVNELLAHSTGPGDWIELHNTTDRPIDIGCWYLSDSADDLRKYQIPAGTTIGPHGYLVFTQRDHFGTAFALSRHGEEVCLTGGSADGRLTSYRQRANFGASDQGVSFVRYVASDGRVHFVAGSEPTPGLPNADPLVGPVVINEVMYNPADTGQEYLELYNITSQPVRLCDPAYPDHTWAIDGGVRFSFPTGSELPAGGYALVVGTDPAAFREQFNIPPEVAVYGPFDGRLDNAGEAVGLYKPGEVEAGTGEWSYVLVDGLEYDDRSPWAQLPDGHGPSLERIAPNLFADDPANWYASEGTGSPGAANSGGFTATATADTTSGLAPLTVRFQASPTAATACQWDFDDGQTLPEPQATHTFQQYGAYHVTLTVADGPRRVTQTVLITVGAVPGDANGDGKVSISDLGAVADNYGRLDASWREGDFNADGKVGVADLVALADNYGYDAAGGSGAVGAGSAGSALTATAALAAPADAAGGPQPSRPTGPTQASVPSYSTSVPGSEAPAGQALLLVDDPYLDVLESIRLEPPLEGQEAVSQPS